MSSRCLGFYARACVHLFVAVATIPVFAQNAGTGIVRTEVVTGLIRPWDMAFISSHQALVTEKQGGLQVVNLATGQKQKINGLPDDLDNVHMVDGRDNSGLFAVTLDPGFPSTPWVYLSYAASNAERNASTTKIIRAKLIDNTLSEIQTLFVALPFTEDRFHYGGGMTFGADGKLYFTIGERHLNESDQPGIPVAQRYSDRRGKIYRINPNGSIPEDNPAFPETVTPGLYALGIRAAQGITRHPKDGSLWFSEHGARQGDEINRLEAGANYGWPILTTGSYRKLDYQPPDLDDRQYQAPHWAWPQTIAPTGLTFYHGDEFPEWEGDLLVAGLSKGNFWRLNFTGGRITQAEELFTDQPVRLRNVRQAPDGKVYLLTDEMEGRILRLQRQ